MRISFLLLCFYWLSSSAANASTLINLGNASCSGSQSFNSSDGLILNCTGDFSLSAGALSSDTSISLSSSGSLSLDDFNLSAPSIMLNAGSIYIKSNVSLIGAFVDLSANRIVYGDQPISSGSAIQIKPGRDIIIPTLPSGSDGSIKLLPGGDISLGSGIRTPSATGANILIFPSGGIITAGSGIIASTESILIPTGILITDGASVPLPTSFTALLTGLMMLVYASWRPFSRK